MLQLLYHDIRPLTVVKTVPGCKTLSSPATTCGASLSTLCLISHQTPNPTIGLIVVVIVFYSDCYELHLS